MVEMGSLMTTKLPAVPAQANVWLYLETMRVLVAGSSGLIGTELVRALTDRGDRVTRLVRRPPEAADEVFWDPGSHTLPHAALHGVDAVVNLCGVGVADKRWTDEYKKLILSSRVDPTHTLAHAMARLDQPIRLLNASAVGFYGDRGEAELTEDARAGEGFLAEVVRQWEDTCRPAVDAGHPVAMLRTGIVVSREGGAMAKVLPLAKLGLGGPLGSGRQFWPLITLHDHVAATLFLLDHPEVTGPVNLTAVPVRQREFASELGRQLNRPAFMPAPAFALRLALDGFASEILGSQRVLPAVLEAAGFTPTHDTLASAVAWLLRAA